MKAEHHIKVEHSAAAEHRKELRTNALADRMGRFMQTVRQRPKGRVLLIVVLLIVAIVAGVLWYLRSGSFRQQNSDAWKFVYQGYVDDVIQEYPNTKQAEIAHFEKNWSFLWDATAQVQIKAKNAKGQPVQKPVVIHGGIANLKSAANVKNPEEVMEGQRIWFNILEKDYQELYDTVKADQILGSEALYDLAVVLETAATFDIKKLDAAKTAFQKVRDEYKETARALLATQRLADAYDTAEKFNALREFYQDFAGDFKLNKQGDEFD